MSDVEIAIDELDTFVDEVVFPQINYSDYNKLVDLVRDVEKSAIKK